MMIAPAVIRLIALLSSTLVDDAEVGIAEQIGLVEGDVLECRRMAREHLGGVLRERGIKEYRAIRDPLLVQQHADVVQELLGALDRERRNQEIAAGAERVVDLL